MREEIKTPLSKIIFYLANGFGLGLIPKAPGTFGTLLAFIIYFFIVDFSLTGFFIYFSSGLVFSILIVHYGHKYYAQVDDKRIVIDEYFAFSVLLYFVEASLVYWLAAFVLFRFFDIFKPFPIKQIDQSMNNALGVILDDLLAAFYSYIVIYLFNNLIRVLIG